MTTTPAGRYRALCSLVLGDAFGNRRELAPGERFDAGPEEMGGLKEGEAFERTDRPGYRPTPLRLGHHAAVRPDGRADDGTGDDDNGDEIPLEDA